MVITRQTRANETAKLWRMQYPDHEWPDSYVCKADEIDALGPNPDPDAVDEIIGNRSWTDIRCNVCGKEADAVSIISDTWGDTTLQVCGQCLADSLAEMAKMK